MSGPEKQRALDALAENVVAMLEYGLPRSLTFFFLTYILARWVV